MVSKHEQDVIVSNLRFLAPRNEMTATLLLAADEIERLQAIVDSCDAECPPDDKLSETSV